MKEIIKKREGNIIYVVDKTKFNPIILKVLDEDENLLEQKEYHLKYANAVAGYDVQDCVDMEEMLDEMIKRHKTDTVEIKITRKHEKGEYEELKSEAMAKVEFFKKGWGVPIDSPMEWELIRREINKDYEKFGYENPLEIYPLGDWIEPPNTIKI